jgi:hypothetical protein
MADNLHDLDVCQCGDYRRSHKEGIGPCNLNSLGHGVPGYQCEKFVLRHLTAPTPQPLSREEMREMLTHEWHKHKPPIPMGERRIELALAFGEAIQAHFVRGK